MYQIAPFFSYFFPGRVWPSTPITNSELFLVVVAMNIDIFKQLFFPGEHAPYPLNRLASSFVVVVDRYFSIFIWGSMPLYPSR